MLSFVAAGLVAGCGSRGGTPSAVASGSPVGSRGPSLSPSEVAAAREAGAADYAWFGRVAELRKGFCFVWVKDVRPAQVLKRMGAKELERIGWRQMVGAGDGQRGAIEKYYFGVSRLDDEWSLVIEDNGSLGRADELLRPLSEGTTLVCLYRAADGSGRFLLLEDGAVQLDFDPQAPNRRSGARVDALAQEISAVGIGAGGDATAGAFALAERATGVGLSLEMLQERTYLFSEVPTGQRKSQ
ncbi:DUF6461 domain-containing protein [Paractinoplanes lichenicola]|uniref:DUF6461 domain-containing protein n=1 Tax=Paractinoplanes lichenicola TaxID=2802976 RepID=UPI001F3A0B9B|nr:DUF6461 domain-containing protein [Actinoplanes lichenicola]